MTLRVLITRPTENAANLTNMLLFRGYEVVHEPLLFVHFLECAVNLVDVQAVLITSTNGARAIAMATTLRTMPVFAVGNISARTCHELGFNQVMAAGGDVTDLVNLVTDCLRPENGTLLHATSKVTAGNLDKQLRQVGFFVRKVVLYEANTATALSPSTIKLITDGAIEAVMFYSPRTAATFATLITEAGVSSGLAVSRAYCLSMAVKHNLTELPWMALHVADTPDQESLLTVFDRNQAFSYGKRITAKGEIDSYASDSL